MTSAPLISVILPVHNGARFLRQALDSIVSQTLRDFELTVVNDGSTDNTQEILREYERADPRIKLHDRQQSGIVASLNTALALSSGELVARMDADDIAFVDRFERQAQFMRAHPQVGVLGGNAVVIDVDGRELGDLRFPTADRQIRSALATTNPFCHSATMLRRSVLEATGGYRRAFPHAEDFDLWLRVSEHCQLANLRETVLYYRWHADQVSARRLQDQVFEAIAARVSAQFRRSGAYDPIADCEQVSEELIAELGIPNESVQSEVLAEIAARAMVLASLGLQRDACTLLDEALSQANLSVIHRRVRAQVAVACARARFGKGSVSSGLSWLVRAWTAHPAYVFEATLRGARDIGLPLVMSRLARRKELRGPASGHI